MKANRIFSIGMCALSVACSTLPETTVTKNSLGERAFGIEYDSKLSTLAMSPERRVFFVATDQKGENSIVCAEPQSDVGVDLR
jgi:hypothetical protein